MRIVCKKIRRNAGFTLIELLIAVSIFAVIAVNIYSLFHTGMLAYRKIEGSTRLFSDAHFALVRMDQDLRNSIRFSKDNSLFSGKKNSISFVTLVNSYRNGRLVSELAMVTYALDHTTLTRLCRTNREALKEISAVKPQEVAGNIESLEFNYGFQEKPNAPVRFERTSWEANNTMPVAIKIRIAAHDTATHSFERTVYLPLAYDDG